MICPNLVTNSDPVGRTLGSYRIESRLGAGGMGEVYRARDMRLERPVAVKMLPPEVAADTERFRRFQGEARAISALNHPHILVVHDIGEAEGRPFIVTELVEGRTLRQAMDERAIPLRDAIDIGTQVASALAAAHARGIVHRDIKPDNIMMRPDGYVKVLDFGLAKVSVSDGPSDETACMTGTGIVMGTPEYMSPEQAAGEAVDFRSDQFAFGILMYELLSGRRPFRRASAVMTAAAIITDSPEPLARLCPDLPPPLWWAIERCLAKRREDRYGSTEDLYRELTTIQGRISDVQPLVTPLPSANLPAVATSFVGRDDDAAAVRQLVEQGDVRWVTLTGPGGVGKTRLALHVAREVAAAFGGATYFVPLGSVSGPEQLISSLAVMFDVPAGSGEAALAHLVRHLRGTGQPLLLLLDNFEHVVSAAVQVAELLERCENLTVLATSRARLNISAEHEYQVAPLMIPSSRASTVETLAASPAVRLFVERARSARAGFTLTPENAEPVAQICLALDGLPLAIELAAARIKVLPPDALLTRIAGRSLSLDGGARDRPARQQTLRATIDWSYELLTPAEQRLFRRLGVFVGGWTLEAAEAVCDAREDLGIDVFDGIASLVDKSLVRSLEPEGGEPRFTMLTTIRQYALERLDKACESAMTRKAHAAYCLVVAEESGSDASAQAAWLAACEAEHGNFRAAIDYLIDTRQAEWAMRLSSALLPFWQARAWLREGRDALTRALALTADDEVSPTRARALFSLGTIVFPMGQPDLCEVIERQALDQYRALGDRQGQAVALNARGVAYHRLEQYDEARQAFDEAVSIWRELGAEQATLRLLSNLAALAFDAGESDRAITLYRETRGQCDLAGDEPGAAWAINGEARVEHARGGRDRARQLYAEALARFERIHDDWGTGDSLLALGIVAGETGDLATAQSRLAQALTVFRRVGDIRGVVRIVEAVAHLAALHGEAERALTLAGAAASTRRALSTPLGGAQQQRLETTLDEMRRRIDPGLAGRAWMRGWSMSADEAVTLALAGWQIS
jgi:predicted ATPase/serine/threonine protein kinase